MLNTQSHLATAQTMLTVYPDECKENPRGAIGCVLKVCHAHLSVPHAVALSRARARPALSHAAAQGFLPMVQVGGIGGFYAGVVPTLIAMFPYVGVEFMVYETLKRRWELWAGVPAGTLALLILGAIGGAAAQVSPP